MAAVNVLGQDDRPRFFPIRNAPDLGLEAPRPEYGAALRANVRSLAGMQKEALVVSSGSDTAWRLASDEGPYLAGHDEAPFPLAFMAAGMIASYFTETVALAAQRGVVIRDLRMTLDNYYTMEGSALHGTMVGGALAPELKVAVGAESDHADLRNLYSDAAEASPVASLLRRENVSRFTLTSDSRALSLGRVTALDIDTPPDPAPLFGEIDVGESGAAGQLVTKTATAAAHTGEGGAGSSLRAEQKRTLHVQATCTAQPNGIRDIQVNLFKPTGSSFHFVSDETNQRAPDALTFISAGIGFCFMTQLGRYAAITKKQLAGYRIIQDTRFSAGASGDTGKPGTAEPVQTHVYLDTPEDDEFARTLVDMGEQTCFLHALCRTAALKLRLRVP